MGCLCFVDNKRKIQNKFKLEDSLSSYIDDEKGNKEINDNNQKDKLDGFIENNKERKRKNEEINNKKNEEINYRKNEEINNRKNEEINNRKNEEVSDKKNGGKKPGGIKSNKLIYDAIFSCDSLKNLYDPEKGWKYFMTDKFKTRLSKEKNKTEDNFCPICIIGDSNKGKTFIANLLIENPLKCGGHYKTRGISCKLSDFHFKSSENKNEKFLIFDSGGRSEPLLIEPEDKAKLNDESLKMTVESNNRDLKQSGEFMRNFLINNSKIIIVMVNQLSLSEQLFLYDLKTEKKYEELFIIHNLYIFKTKNEIENYINNTLITSIYFDITKGYYETLDPHEKFKPYYFKEEQKQGNDEALIAHLILGDFDSKDEWIKHFNKRTLEFLKDKMQICIAKDYFNMEKMLEKELRDTNKINEKSKLIKENVENSNNKEKGILKIENKKQEENHEDGDFVDDTDFNVMKYTPDYIFYKDNENFVIEVECAGSYDNKISIMGKSKQGKVYFKIKGKKIYPTELKKEDKPFYIYFSVNTEKENIIIDTSPEINNKKPTHENGIYKKKFPIKKEEATDLIESTRY